MQTLSLPGIKQSGRQSYIQNNALFKALPKQIFEMGHCLYLFDVVLKASLPSDANACIASSVCLKLISLKR